MEEEEVREATTSENAHLVLGLFAGAVFMAIFAMIAHSATVSDSGSVVSFEQLNMSHRDITVNTSSGDRIGCTISRFNEVQISEMSYVYGNGSCVSSLQADGSEVDIPTEKIDVLFRVNESQFDLGFDLPESYVVCDIAEGEEQQADSGKLVYTDAECSSSSGSLYEKWNDTEFENFNVHDRGREVLENESSN